MREVLYAERFARDVAGITSRRLLAQLDERLSAIESFPEMGSDDVRPALTRRLGKGLRRFPLPPFVIVYRYLKEEDRLEFLALPKSRQVP